MEDWTAVVVPVMQQIAAALATFAGGVEILAPAKPDFIAMMLYDGLRRPAQSKPGFLQLHGKKCVIRESQRPRSEFHIKPWHPFAHPAME